MHCVYGQVFSIESVDSLKHLSLLSVSDGFPSLSTVERVYVKLGEVFQDINAGTALLNRKDALADQFTSGVRLNDSIA